MKKWWWIIPVVLILAGVGYFYYQGYQKSLTEYLPGTFINGIDVSGKKPVDVDKILNEPARSFVVTERDAQTREPMTETIDLRAMGYTQVFDTQGVLDRQRHGTWFYSYWEENHQEISYEKFTIDENKVAAAVAGLYCMQPENNVAPMDAKLVADKGIYSITPSDDGCQIDKDAAAKMIQEAVMAEETSIDLTQQEGLYAEAAVKTDDEGLLGQMEEYNKVWTKTITIPMYGEVKEVIDETLLRRLLIPNGFDVSINEAELTKYVDELFTKYSTWKAKRNFTTSKGKTIQVGSELDIFGYDLAKQETKDSIHEVLLSKEDCTADAYWDGVGHWSDKTGNDIGETYVEISIADQHLWYYVDGKLAMETDIVSGTKGKTDSPTGVFCIWAKRTKVTLIGDDYQTFVELWLPFDFDGTGIHDASWRSSFGGDIYETSGSHGCINTPYSFCQPFYDMIELETPVVIY